MWGENRQSAAGDQVTKRDTRPTDHPSARRLNENDKPLVYPTNHEVKVVSTSGHLAHEGKNYQVGEVFAGKRVGLHLNPEGRTELHFANVHLGNLAYDAEGGRFRPAAYVARPSPKPTAKRSRTSRTKPR